MMELSFAYAASIPQALLSPYYAKCYRFRVIYDFNDTVCLLISQMAYLPILQVN